MKCLTVMQPFAWAILTGRKRVENRIWPTAHRGPLLIHAGKGDKYMDRTVLQDGTNVQSAELVFGAIVGCVDVIDCVPVAERKGDPFAVGPWCFVLSNPLRFATPVPYRGLQKIFDVPDNLVKGLI